MGKMTFGEATETLRTLHCQKRVLEDCADYLARTYLAEESKAMVVKDPSAPVAVVHPDNIRKVMDELLEMADEAEESIEEIKKMEVRA